MAAQVCVCSSVGVCGEPASLLFLMYENLCTLRGGGRRRKKGTQPRISTSSSVSLSFFLDACFLFTPFPPLFTRRLAPSPTPAKPLFFPSSFFPFSRFLSLFLRLDRPNRTISTPPLRRGSTNGIGENATPGNPLDSSFLAGLKRGKDGTR